MSTLLRAIAANLKKQQPRVAQKAEEETSELVDLVNSVYKKIQKVADPAALHSFFGFVRGMDLVDSVDFKIEEEEEPEADDDSADELPDLEKEEEAVGLDLDGDNEFGEDHEFE